MLSRAGVSIRALEPDRGLYVPEPARVVRAEQMTATEKLLEVERLSGEPLGHEPGQFVQVFVPGIGDDAAGGRDGGGRGLTAALGLPSCLGRRGSNSPFQADGKQLAGTLSCGGTVTKRLPRNEAGQKLGVSGLHLVAGAGFGDKRRSPLRHHSMPR